MAALRRKTDTLQQVIGAFEEEVAARQIAATSNKKDQWSQSFPGLLPKLA